MGWRKGEGHLNGLLEGTGDQNTQQSNTCTLDFSLRLRIAQISQMALREQKYFKGNALPTHRVWRMRTCFEAPLASGA